MGLTRGAPRRRGCEVKSAKRNLTQIKMLSVRKNKFVITYLAFTGGFLMVFVGKMVMAVDVPESAPLYEFTTPTVHSMDIAGGYNAGSGVSINNDGKFQIKTRTLTGSYLNPLYGLNINSEKGGLHAISPYNPVAGRNDIKYGNGSNPNEYGRVGVEGRVVGNEAGTPVITKGFLGYVQHFSLPYDEYEPIPASVPNSLLPSAFYTTGNTYLGDTVTVNGALKNYSSGVNIAGNAVVQGNVEASDELETDTLDFSNVANLKARFLIGDPDAIVLESWSDADGISNDEIFGDTDSCAPDAYLVGCTGYVVGANSYAPYRGAKMTSPTNGTTTKGGACTAYAKSLGSATPFQLVAVAYCFDPN